ncbi:hypothetical protein [Pseudovibrio japonicus]|nr:hypothetical protein [Pseudovibrio japonicus]
MVRWSGGPAGVYWAWMNGRNGACGEVHGRDLVHGFGGEGVTVALPGR